METVTPGVDDWLMELVMNLAAGLSGLVFALVGVYSLASIWSDDLP